MLLFGYPEDRARHHGRSDGMHRSHDVMHPLSAGQNASQRVPRPAKCLLSPERRSSARRATDSAPAADQRGKAAGASAAEPTCTGRITGTASGGDRQKDGLAQNPRRRPV